MKAKFFNRKHHAHFINRMLVDRGMDSSLTDELPPYGYVIFHRRKVLAAGFFRRLEHCATAMVDSYITDPSAQAGLRNQALDLLTSVLASKAAKIGISRFIAMTTESNILTRSLKHGWEVLSHQCIGLHLERK